MKLHCWEPLMMNHHATKIGGHRHCGSGDIMILVCHMILQDHVIKCCSSLWLEASKGKSAYCYGAIIRTEIACNKKIYYKSILNSVYPRSRTQLYINKNKYFWLSELKLAENLILIFDFYEKRVTKFVRVIGKIFFI